MMLMALSAGIVGVVTFTALVAWARHRRTQSREQRLSGAARERLIGVDVFAADRRARLAQLQATRGRRPEKS